MVDARGNGFRSTVVSIAPPRSGATRAKRARAHRALGERAPHARVDRLRRAVAEHEDRAARNDLRARDLIARAPEQPRTSSAACARARCRRRAGRRRPRGARRCAARLLRRDLLVIDERLHAPRHLRLLGARRRRGSGAHASGGGRLAVDEQRAALQRRHAVASDGRDPLDEVAPAVRVPSSAAMASSSGGASNKTRCRAPAAAAAATRPSRREPRHSRAACPPRPRRDRIRRDDGG